MSRSQTVSLALQDLPIWKKMEKKGFPHSFDLEITARCNNNCRHCYINLPANDANARKKEPSAVEIDRISDEAVSLGAFWCLISGGEPLLREDFIDIYLSLKKKGLLVSIFTNAMLVTSEHIRIFKKFPPRIVEVTVYGVTPATYEKVTRRSGSFTAFRRGLDLLLENGINVRLKSMALRSNVREIPAIAEFCRARTVDFFRFDPMIHLRYDGDASRNREILAERLSPPEVAAIEKADEERSEALKKGCDHYINPHPHENPSNILFRCGAGVGSFTVGHEGSFRLCSSLWHPQCVYDLRQGSLAEALATFIPKVRAMTSARKIFLEKCQICPIINLCLWCPAHSYLESGELDLPADSFCRIAQARADQIRRE